MKEVEEASEVGQVYQDLPAPHTYLIILIQHTVSTNTDLLSWRNLLLTFLAIGDTPEPDPMRKLNLLNTGRPVSLTSIPGGTIGGVSEVSGDASIELSKCSPPLISSTSAQLQQLYSHCPPGTVVFLQPEQTLVFKVDNGWRYIVVRLLLIY